MAFVFMWTMRKGTLEGIMEGTSINIRTAVDCRQVVVYSYFQTQLQIDGSGETEIGIDETKVGRRKFHRDHVVEGQWVFCDVEPSTNKCCIVPGNDHSKQTLLPLLKKIYQIWFHKMSDYRKVIINIFIINYFIIFLFKTMYREEGYTHYKVIKLRQPTNKAAYNKSESSEDDECVPLLKRRRQ